MTDKPWIEEARRLIEGGTSVTLTARAIGTSEYSVRFTLDINGFRERRRLEAEAVRARMAAGKPAKKEPAPATINRARWQNDAAPVAGSRVTLPALSILASAEAEPAKVIRFAPKTRFRTEPAGVAIIRAIHQRMIRSGKIAQPGIHGEMHS